MKLSEWLVEPKTLSEISTVALDAPSLVGERLHPVAEKEVVRASQPGAGALLADRYSDLGELGRGSTASVRRVVDHDLHRHVAMKVLRPSACSDDTQMRDFYDEAQITAQLDHPNIPPVHELGLDAESTRYFTMKLVRGRTLAARVRELDPEREISSRLQELLPIFSTVCDAVAFAHSRGVVHRDIKPENVMVGNFGEVYLMDWGLARLVGGAAERAAADAVQLVRDPARIEALEKKLIAGTPGYMSPEQALGHIDQIDERTDVFCLGALLYFLLAGKAPYAGVGLKEALRRAALTSFPPVEDAAGETVLPAGICAISARAMARVPQDRYQSVTELKRAVDEFLRGGLHLPTRTYLPGSLIVVEGAPGDAAFIIARGRCVVWKAVDGERLVLREMGPGAVFGEMALLSHAPRSATVEAVDLVTVTVVERQLLEAGLGKDSWIAALLTTLAARFREVDEKLHPKSSGSSES